VASQQGLSSMQLLIIFFAVLPNLSPPTNDILFTHCSKTALITNTWFYHRHCGTIAPTHFCDRSIKEIMAHIVFTPALHQKHLETQFLNTDCSLMGRKTLCSGKRLTTFGGNYCLQRQGKKLQENIKRRIRSVKFKRMYRFYFRDVTEKVKSRNVTFHEKKQQQQL
jgi:hypothetical protein